MQAIARTGSSTTRSRCSRLEQRARSRLVCAGAPPRHGLQAHSSKLTGDRGWQMGTVGWGVLGHFGDRDADKGARPRACGPLTLPAGAQRNSKWEMVRDENGKWIPAAKLARKHAKEAEAQQTSSDAPPAASDTPLELEKEPVDRRASRSPSPRHRRRRSAAGAAACTSYRMQP